MKRLLLYIFTVLPWPIAMGQTVTNIQPKQVGKTIEITYDLSEEANISLYVVIDGQYTLCKSVTGDVGENISKGHKKLVWNVLADRNSLDGDNIRFSVSPTTSSRNKAKISRKNYLKSQREKSIIGLHPMSGFDGHGGGVGIGLSAYWGYVYNRYSRWGSYISYTAAFLDYTRKDVAGFHSIFCGATCTLHRYCALFFSPGLNIARYEKKVTISNPTPNSPFGLYTYEYENKLGFAAEVGLGVRCHSGFLVTFRASYPWYVGMGIGMDLGWYD